MSRARALPRCEWTRDLMDFHKELDVRGLACPLPVTRARKALRGMTPGQVLKVIATDSGSLIDIKDFAEATGYELLSAEARGREFVFFLRS